jgi:hypothetical protein
MLSRMFPGLGLDNGNSPRWDTLPFGMDRRFLINSQVGSVENPGGADYPAFGGWPIEEILKLSPDETQALQAIRQEYAAERKKLDEEVAEFHKAEVEKLRALRLKYEQKANEALSPEQREAKQKFDALRDELIAKKKALVSEVLGPDPSNGALSRAALSNLREGLPKIVAEIEAKFLELLPAEAKAKIEPMLKQQAAMRERMAHMYSQSQRPMPTQPGGPPQPPMVRQNVPPTQPAAQPAVQPPAPPPEKPQETHKDAEAGK